MKFPKAFIPKTVFGEWHAFALHGSFGPCRCQPLLQTSDLSCSAGCPRTIFLRFSLSWPYACDPGERLDFQHLVMMIRTFFLLLGRLHAASITLGILFSSSWPCSLAVYLFCTGYDGDSLLWSHHCTACCMRCSRTISSGHKQVKHIPICCKDIWQQSNHKIVTLMGKTTPWIDDAQKDKHVCMSDWLQQYQTGDVGNNRLLQLPIRVFGQCPRLLLACVSQTVLPDALVLSPSQTLPSGPSMDGQPPHSRLIEASCDLVVVDVFIVICLLVTVTGSTLNKPTSQTPHVSELCLQRRALTLSRVFLHCL